MASNKNALIRYKVIDQCLRNSFRRWTLNDLIDACSEALFEYEGKDVFVSKRTVQLDIQHMRSDKLGYEAPIEVYDRKYYRYTDPNYSIKNIPIREGDIAVIQEAITVLKEFKDFSLFEEMNGVVQRLEDSVFSNTSNQRRIIHLDKNELLRGLEFIDPLYRAIKDKKAVDITYQSFKAAAANVLTIHPQLLKEFNNRWFVLAYRKNNMATFALDRIQCISNSVQTDYIDCEVDGDTYYEHVVGVTVANSEVQDIEFWVDKKNTPYVLTKPLHKSQQLLRTTADGSYFSMAVIPNRELERLLLGFGHSLLVTKPQKLKDRLFDHIKRSTAAYKALP